MKKLALALLLIIVTALLAGTYYFYWPLRDPHPAYRHSATTLAIVNAKKIYVSPDQPALEHGTVVVKNGVISEVGENLQVPSDAQLMPCNGCVVMAGFWNTHVHFTQPQWNNSAWKPANELNSDLRHMLTSRGFTTVVDASSDIRTTVSLRRRIASGELLGPYIYTAGSGLYPPNGIPFYVRESLPFYIRWLVPQPRTPEEATKIETINIERGADLLKLFTGSYVARGKILPMPVEIARAAVNVAHAHGQIAYAHPSNLAGTRVAMDSGVDVLAHAPDTTDGITPELLQQIVQQHMTMIPTLKMFATTVTTAPGYLQPIYGIVRQFHQLGGTLIFGTDVGYMTDYSTEDEFRALQECGLNATDMLRMLTTNPAERFAVADRKGTIGVGKDGDLTVLASDPATDVTAFSAVIATTRGGRVLYQKP
jgi:imidazolonepropionase-like amidohydrolase